MTYFIGVDVGTGSARAGLFDVDGNMIYACSHKIQTWHPRPDFAQQSTTDIWAAVCHCVHDVIRYTETDVRQISGIGFDATCSLVAAGAKGSTISVSPDGESDQDVILWSDHRAKDIAKRIDGTGHDRLRISGGTISPEMQIPKLVWLKENLPFAWEETAHFFDLPDWLTWKASGSLKRSLCTVVCKWTYDATKGEHGKGWDNSFFKQIGLGDLATENYRRIGQEMAAPGEPVGNLTDEAARDLGLSKKTRVAVGMIDAHAGALGTLGCAGDGATMALIAGTSACHITLSGAPAYVPGVWGPYLGAVLPGLWVNEAGQSMAGAALDTIINRHAAGFELRFNAAQAGHTPHGLLEERVLGAAERGFYDQLAKNRHIVPDFNGNRSPLADPSRLGMIVGQNTATDMEDLVVDYLAGIQSLAYGTRQIIEQLESQSVPTTQIVVSGGLAKNRIYCQSHADITGCKVVIPDQPEPVLLGSAMLAARASGAFPTTLKAMHGMSRGGKTLVPRSEVRAFHDKKYNIFKSLQDQFKSIQTVMHG
ncbi:FGGY-family carbohydrate kinase [Tateyamaria omphalii]|uniref:FGGY-family carbohydrate kinase n=1 Tax=Tateyamaria omphalii TaxID=299262 RepID=UPI001C98F28E|nr:FGGY-family carbohydrate kinase [Tateyamaria omphalii]MBY5934940.1 FGGY-family carbohydrate kinase [Tateyamaria omphalii]